MALNNFKCNYLTPLHFKGLKANEEALVHARETRSILQTIWYRQQRWLGHILRYKNFLHDIIEGKMIATRDRKTTELLHIMEGQDCG